VRVVLDANVVISRFLTPERVSARVYRKWEAGLFDVVATNRIVTEFAKVLCDERLMRQHRMNADAVEQVLNDIRSAVIFVDDREIVVPALRDPHDVMFVQCGIDGSVDYLITGDRDLLDLRDSLRIPIISPGVLLAMLEVGET
jgi:putative PIN family toxin of toxin-antitoxin system